MLMSRRRVVSARLLLREEGKGGAKWSEAQLKAGLQACQAIEADPTGATGRRAGCAACSC